MLGTDIVKKAYTKVSKSKSDLDKKDLLKRYLKIVYHLDISIECLEDRIKQIKSK